MSGAVADSDELANGPGVDGQADESEMRRAKPFVVVLLFLALLVGVGSVVSLVRAKVGDFDGTELVQALFPDGPPLGFEHVDSYLLDGGRKAVRLRRERPVDEAVADPTELLFVLYPSAASVVALFREHEDERGGRGGRGGNGSGEGGASARWANWEEDPSFAWSTLLDGGELSWGGWKADYLIERYFHEGGSWHENASVNLAQAGRHLVLSARWPDEHEVDQERLRVLLRRMTLLTGPS